VYEKFNLLPAIIHTTIMIDIIIGLLALVLLFFLPGFLLALIIWPKKDSLSMEYDLLLKCVIGMVFSMIISILVGIVLYGIDGMQAPKDTQSIRLWLILSVISIILGSISWNSGGLRDLVIRKPNQAKGGRSIDDDLNRLSAEKRKLQEKIAMMESEEYKSDKVLIEEAAVRIPALKKEIAAINQRIDELVESEEIGAEGEKVV